MFDSTRLLGCVVLVATLGAWPALGCAVKVPGPPEPREQISLRLASTQWPPFTDVVGQPRVANDLISRALAGDGVEIEDSIVPIQGWLPSILDGEFDGSAAVWYSEDRAEFLLYSAPYLENRLVLIGGSDSDVSAESFSDLDGQRIGLVEGYAYGDELREAQGPTFIGTASTAAGLRALLAGEVDYVLADALLAQYSLASHPERARFKVGEHALVSKTLHFAVRRELPGAQAIIDAFDARVRQMTRLGTLNQILGMTWIETDVDGDGETDLVLAGDHAGIEAPEGSYRLVRTPKAKKVRLKRDIDYFIQGERYHGWENVPDHYKVEVGGINLGIGIEW